MDDLFADTDAGASVIQLGEGETFQVMSPMGLILAQLTESTCGEACWNAHEDACKCSCGGINHGILKVVVLDSNGNRVLPKRTCKIDGYPYELVDVGYYNKMGRLVSELMKEHQPRYRKGNTYTRLDGSTFVAGYNNYWNESTDKGCPYRIKTAATNQMKWEEVETFLASQSIRNTVYLVWKKIDIDGVTMVKQQEVKQPVVIDVATPPLLSPPVSRRNWTEDYTQENGQHEHKCILCEETFYGNKHRKECRVCHLIEEHHRRNNEQQQAQLRQDIARLQEQLQAKTGTEANARDLVKLVMECLNRYETLDAITVKLKSRFLVKEKK